jgi:hypothetical protein
MMDFYPHAPALGKTDTSEEAAAFMERSAGTIRDKSLVAIRKAGARGLTAAELADALGMERSTVQPRTTELRLMDRIADSGRRRPNPNGKRAIVWIAKGVRS